MRVHSIALHLVDDQRPHANTHVRSDRDRDEGARSEDTDLLGFFFCPSTLACWNPDAIL